MSGNHTNLMSIQFSLSLSLPHTLTYAVCEVLRPASQSPRFGEGWTYSLRCSCLCVHQGYNRQAQLLQEKEYELRQQFQMFKNTKRSEKPALEVDNSMFKPFTALIYIWTCFSILAFKF